jgi:hypothetical protein
MKRAIFAALAVAVIGSSSGCCLLDRMFSCHNGLHQWDRAKYGGGCETCGDDPGYVDGHGGGCRSCGLGGRLAGGGHMGGGGRLAGRHMAGEPVAGPAGPPTGAVTYPYYTTRGPRDFLAKNPKSIGP